MRRRRPAGDSAARSSPSRISSSSSQCSASSITWLETSSVAPPAASERNVAQRSRAQHRVEPDGRLVEDQHLGLAEQRRGQRDTGALAAGEVADHLVGLLVQADGLDHLGDALMGDPEHPGEVPEVLADAEIEVDGGRLGHVADPARSSDEPAGRP